MVLKISSKLKNLELYFDEYTYSEHIVAVFSVLN